MIRRGFMGIAAAGTMAFSTWAHAEQAPSFPDSAELTLQPTYLDPAPPAPDRGPIMYGLDKIGAAKPLEDLGIKIFGHVEGSYTYNLVNPPDAFPENPIRVFDSYHDNVILNSFDLQIDRAVDSAKFDVGGHFEIQYGRDARFLHSNGLFDWHNDDVHPPVNQWDLTQLYLTVNVPVGGSAVLLTAGKWVTLLGYEVIDPTGNALFSRSILFGFAIPFTNTGVVAKYTTGDWTFQLGATRGWDQANEDSNGAMDAIGQVGWAHGEWGVIFNFISGPEQAGDNSHWRTVADLSVTWAPDKSDWKFAVNADYGYDSNIGIDGDAAQWYGIAGYVSWKLPGDLGKYATANGRVEAFRDDDGTRTGIRGNFYEVTVGLAIQPFPDHELLKNITIRPEFRWDHATEDYFDGGTKKNQETLALDVVVKL